MQIVKYAAGSLSLNKDVTDPELTRSCPHARHPEIDPEPQLRTRRQADPQFKRIPFF